MNKIDRQDLAWVIFHGINWKRDIKSAAVAFLKRSFPDITKFLDESKYYSDISKAKTPEELIAQSIKTDFGKTQLAKVMCGSLIK